MPSRSTPSPASSASSVSPSSSAQDDDTAPISPQADDLRQQAQTVEASGGGALTREDRIRQAAYARAAERGFAPGGDLDDWLHAERAIDGMTGAEGATKGQSSAGGDSGVDPLDQADGAARTGSAGAHRAGRTDPADTTPSD